MLVSDATAVLWVIYVGDEISYKERRQRALANKSAGCSAVPDCVLGACEERAKAHD